MEVPSIYQISDIYDKYRSPQRSDISQFYCISYLRLYSVSEDQFWRPLQHTSSTRQLQLKPWYCMWVLPNMCKQLPSCLVEITTITGATHYTTPFTYGLSGPRYPYWGPDSKKGRGLKMLGSHIRVGIGGVAALQGGSPTNTSKTPWCMPSLHTRLAMEQYKNMKLEDQCMVLWVMVE